MNHLIECRRIDLFVKIQSDAFLPWGWNVTRFKHHLSKNRGESNDYELSVVCHDKYAHVIPGSNTEGSVFQPLKGHGFVLCLYVNTIIHVSFTASVSTLTERLRKRQRCCKTAIKITAKLLKWRKSECNITDSISLVSHNTNDTVRKRTPIPSSVEKKTSC